MKSVYVFNIMFHDQCLTKPVTLGQVCACSQVSRNFKFTTFCVVMLKFSSKYCAKKEMVVDAILQWNCAKKITLPVSQALPQPFFLA